MDAQEEVNKIRYVQNFLGAYTDVALENIKNAPFIFIDHLEYTELFITDEKIEIGLIYKKGLKSWLYRTFRKRHINANLILLAKYIYYWVPTQKIKPKIEFYWEKDYV